MAEQWQISLEEGFRLTDSDGREVRVGQRKCEELLYAIASRNEERIWRDSLAEEIWPLDSSKARRDNFRQALRKLRRAVGQDRIVADRVFVGFAPGFKVIVAPEAGVKANVSDEKRIPAAEGFLRLLEWQAADEPNLFFETLRVNTALVHALSPKMIRQLVETAGPKLHVNDSNRHWISFWIGRSHFSSQGLVKAEPHLKAALNSGIEIADGRLVLESGAALAISLTLAGRVREATRLLDRVLSTGYIPSAEKRRLEVIRAAAYQHLGKRDDSNRLLQKHTHTSSPLELAHDQALNAFFLATTGNFRAAGDAVGEPIRYAHRIGASGILRNCELALGYIDAYEAPATGAETLDRMATECEEIGFAHLALYAKEGAAIAYVNAGKVSEAKLRWKEALSARRTLSFGLTQWDRRRLVPLETLAGFTSF